MLLDNGTSPANSLAINASASTLASGSAGDGIRLWQIDALDVPPVVIPNGLIYQVAFSPDGKRLVSGGANVNYLRLWDLPSSGRSRVLIGHQATVVSLAFSSDGTQLASGGGTGDGTIRL